MAIVTSVDSLTQFTVDLLRFSAAEAKYCEYLCRKGQCGGGGGGGESNGVVVTTTTTTTSTSSSRTPPTSSSSTTKSKSHPCASPPKVTNHSSITATNANPPSASGQSVVVVCNGNNVLGNASHHHHDGDDDDDGEASSALSSLSQRIAYAREHIVSSLNFTPSSSHSPCPSSGGGATAEEDKMLRQENMVMKQQLEKLQQEVSRLTLRVGQLESQLGSGGGATTNQSAPAPAVKKVENDDDDVDLFGSDEEDDEEAAKIKEQRVAEYAAKKSQKAKVIAKSNVILDVKPWDDETDMKELEKCVRSVVMDGLLWGTSKLVPVGYGIKKLQIATVVEDDKVSVDELVEKIQEFEDFIQSVDIAAFNKI